METNAPPRRAALFVNAHSRAGRDEFERAQALLVSSGLELVVAEAVTEPARMNEQVRGAIRRRIPLIIVGGGDGTIASIVGEFVNTEAMLVILPLGTANSFARSLDIPLDLETLIQGMAHGRSRQVDLGRIGTHLFANSASIGLSPTVGRTVPDGLKRVFGRLGYGLWVLRCLLALRPFRLKVEDQDGRTLRRTVTEVRILNGAYHAGVALSETAQLASGEIIVQAVTGRSVTNLVRDWVTHIFGQRKSTADVIELRGRKFRIETSPRRSISIDGEVLDKTPVDVEALSGAIHVFIPMQEKTKELA